MKNFRKLTLKKDRTFLALYLEDAALKENYDENGDLVYIPFYTSFTSEKKTLIDLPFYRVLTDLFNFSKKTLQTLDSWLNMQSTQSIVLSVTFSP